VSYAARLTHSTSGTAAAGGGVGLELESESGGGNLRVGSTIESVITTATNGAEDYALIFKNMQAGAAAAERFRIAASGTLLMAGRAILLGHADATGGDCNIVLGNARTVSGNAFIDLWADGASGAFSSRFLRNSGTNGACEFVNKGTGALTFVQADAGEVSFWTQTTKRLNIAGTGDITARIDVATPAGGSTSARLLFGTTAGFGIYYGSGVPTVSAAQGSMYLRSDGSSTSTRAYINTDGGTTWTAITTAA
jgi:hypothetical protein